MQRVALVTGGTRGIGAATCLALKSSCCTVIANFGQNEKAAAKFTEKTGIPSRLWDVASMQECQTALAGIEKEFGPIDILVHNAAISRRSLLHEMSHEDWSDVIRTDLDSIFFLTRPILGGMRDRKFGRIIAISSVNGQKGQPGHANYSAAKAGLIGFVKAVAQETAAFGVTVNAIAPGYVATDALAHVSDEALAARVLPHIPVGRLGQPEEIARCVAFLAAEESGFITGTVMCVSGGQLMP